MQVITGAIEDVMMQDQQAVAERVRSATVMVVHEVREHRAVLRRAVERAGMNARLVLEAANGYEALALIAAVRVDLVILPDQMRLMGSVELMARIREGAKRSTAFVMVVEDEETAKVAQKYAGVGGVVMMPVVVEELKRVAEGVFGT